VIVPLKWVMKCVDERGAQVYHLREASWPHDQPNHETRLVGLGRDSPNTPLQTDLTSLPQDSKLD